MHCKKPRQRGLKDPYFSREMRAALQKGNWLSQQNNELFLNIPKNYIPYIHKQESIS